MDDAELPELLDCYPCAALWLCKRQNPQIFSEDQINIKIIPFRLMLKTLRSYC